MNKIFFYYLLTLLFAAQGLCAEEPDFSKYNTLFEKKAYFQALKEISKIEPRFKNNKSATAKILYLKGMAAIKLDRNGLAIEFFKEAIKNGSSESDINFNLGLAHFALKQHSEAKAAFDQSISSNFKTSTCSYYIGYIFQLQEKNDLALQEFAKVSEPDDIRQAALFQTAEITNSPETLRHLISIDPNSKVAKKAKQRLENPHTQSSGVKGLVKSESKSASKSQKKTKPWEVKFSQKVKYDSNVLNQAENTLARVTNASSALSQTDAAASYSLPQIVDHMTITPSVALDYTLHARRDTPRVYQNDSLLGVAQLVVQFEKEKSKTSLEYSYGYLMRDWRRHQDLDFFNETHQVNLSEQRSFFKTGPSLLKVGYKKLRSNDPVYHSYTPSIWISQFFALPRKMQLLISENAEFQITEKKTNDIYTYKSTVSLMIPDVYWKVDLEPALEVYFFNTVMQRPVRGYEKMFSPSMTISAPIYGSLKADLVYKFTRRMSLDTRNYDYVKHAMTLGLSYTL